MDGNPITVARWVPYDEADKLKDCGIGGMGGWFGLKRGQRWRDYLDYWQPEAFAYLEALRADILARKLKQGGDWHQNSDEGCPVFSDGTTATYTYRAWGDLLAAVWSEEENRDYSYMDFYMDATTPKASR